MNDRPIIICPTERLAKRARKESKHLYPNQEVTVVVLKDPNNPKDVAEMNKQIVEQEKNGAMQ